MGRRLVASIALCLGLAMLGFGLYAIASVYTADPTANLPGSEGFVVRDQGIVALMGGCLALLGAVRLRQKVD